MFLMEARGKDFRGDRVFSGCYGCRQGKDFKIAAMNIFKGLKKAINKCLNEGYGNNGMK